MIATKGNEISFAEQLDALGANCAQTDCMLDKGYLKSGPAQQLTQQNPWSPQRAQLVGEV
jgi:hypothetical protein